LKKHVLINQTYTAITYSLFLRPVYTRFQIDDISDLADTDRAASILDFGTIKARGKVLLFDMDATAFARNPQAYTLLAEVRTYFEIERNHTILLFTEVRGKCTTAASGNEVSSCPTKACAASRRTKRSDTQRLAFESIA
jgi:hypothetical protein